MGKENENIHLHIIEEDYDSKKKKQKQRFDISEKAEPIVQLLRHHKSVVKQLERMHTNSAVIAELEQPQTTEEAQQIGQPNTEEPLDATSTSEIFSILQEMKSEEQELIEQKQGLLKKQQELRSLLIQEIDKKKKTIQELKSEVTALQKTCTEISQALERSATS